MPATAATVTFTPRQLVNLKSVAQLLTAASHNPQLGYTRGFVMAQLLMLHHVCSALAAPENTHACPAWAAHPVTATGTLTQSLFGAQ